MESTRFHVIHLSRLFLFVLLVVLAGHGATARGQSSLRGAVVVLDPGHGGDDWGVDPVGSKQREKDVVLDLGARLQRQLEAQGATVHTTRHTDRFVSLGARVRFANALLFRPDNNPNVGRVISLHLNSNRENPGLERVEVLVDPEAEVPQFAVLMAQALQEVTQGGYGYRDEGYPPGVHPADIASIRWTYPRGNNVLTEPVFLSNPAQDALLYDEGFLDRLAKAHVDALVATLR
jgi:N-acetylmuramoyl-L-alanine amidase